MGTEQLPIKELQRLLNGVAEHGAQHLLEVEADMQQTADLLSEAIDKLSAGFMRLHASVVAQQQMVDAVLAGQHADAMQHLGESRERISREVDAVVTGLQFQDMTSQLIDRTLQRIHGLREVLAALAQHSDLAAQQHDTPQHDMTQLLGTLNQSLSLKSGALQDGLRRQVSQKHMESGDIELF